MFEENTLATEEEVLSFVNENGLATLFPVRGLSFPNLYQAIAGKNREEKLQKTWLWADNLSERRKVHYGKFVRKQCTLISLEMLPHFYRIFGKRKLGKTARHILKFLERNGATSTTLLKKNLNLTGKPNRSKFTKAIDELQRTFSVTIVRRERIPRMTYTYDLMERWMPDLIEAALGISEATAIERIRAKLLDSRIFMRQGDAEAFLKNL